MIAYFPPRANQVVSLRGCLQVHHHPNQRVAQLDSQLVCQVVNLPYTQQRSQQVNQVIPPVTRVGNLVRIHPRSLAASQLAFRPLSRAVAQRGSQLGSPLGYQRGNQLVNQQLLNHRVSRPGNQLGSPLGYQRGNQLVNQQLRNHRVSRLGNRQGNRQGSLPVNLLANRLLSPQLSLRCSLRLAPLRSHHQSRPKSIS
jgi:hypothetical protein